MGSLRMAIRAARSVMGGGRVCLGFRGSGFTCRRNFPTRLSGVFFLVLGGGGGLGFRRHAETPCGSRSPCLRVACLDAQGLRGYPKP